MDEWDPLWAQQMIVDFESWNADVGLFVLIFLLALALEFQNDHVPTLWLLLQG